MSDEFDSFDDEVYDDDNRYSYSKKLDFKNKQNRMKKILASFDEYDDEQEPRIKRPDHHKESRKLAARRNLEDYLENRNHSDETDELW